jgi:hypothetical protein
MKIEIRTVINGREMEAAVKPNQTLLEFLRDDLSLRGSCGTYAEVLAAVKSLSDKTITQTSHLASQK